MDFEAWTYRTTSGAQAGVDLTGYKVVAVDGDIGKVDEATYEAGAASIVVDTGPWIFGKKVLLPAGTIERIDTAEQKIYVDRTKDQIKDAPEYDRDDMSYHDKVGNYYSDTYRTGLGGPGL